MKVLKWALSGMLAVMVLSGCTQSNDAGLSTGSWTLVWQDDFNGDVLDAEKWTPIIGDGCPNLCGFGNNELQYYTDEEANLKVSDGVLKLVAHQQAYDDSAYTSAKLVSKHKGDWKYGRVEVLAKLPEGRGTWPAIWMLPTMDATMNWPLDGEIDIMEHVGYHPGMVYGTIHTQKYNHMLGTQKSDSLLVNDVSSRFHNYQLEWSEEHLSWSIDGQTFLTLLKEGNGYEGWPFDQPFHLILNLAVGGNWGGKYGVDDRIWPQSFEIDYVKVYQRL